MQFVTREKTRKNIAKMLGVNDYTELVNADVPQERLIVKRASQKRKIQKSKHICYLSTGNPYVMMGLKVNSKGKYIK